jgi:hypothetical protein
MEGVYQQIVGSMVGVTAVSMAAISFNVMPFMKASQQHYWVRGLICHVETCVYKIEVVHTSKKGENSLSRKPELHDSKGAPPPASCLAKAPPL